MGQIAEVIRIRGTVQGVGFRPTVHRIATACQLRGDVRNDGDGVLVRAIGTASNLETFLTQLQRDCPPLARITTIERHPLHDRPPQADFQIVPSQTTTAHTSIPADAATCAHCLAEVEDPLSRWYRYPFTTCTHCGPRFSLVQRIPYDRAHTSMACFGLCPQCQQEYQDIRDRRFHAQPIACPTCGPQVALLDVTGQPVEITAWSPLDALDAVAQMLRQGAIVAIKGVGGFHLACDATNSQAVQTLRQRKQRQVKPFALMMRDLAIVERYCQISASERQVLTQVAAPIVLLQVLLQRHSQSAARPLAAEVAPGLDRVGVMLPYTPLHHLICQSLDRPIVLTSGNASRQPQVIDNQEALQQLQGIADYYLLHDRAIVNRLDDSVVQVVTDQPQFLRRARGYAPDPLPLPLGFASTPSVVAMGSELKTTLCFTRGAEALLSQHLGDLEQEQTFTAYQDTLDRYLQLFEHQPQVIAIDLHPDYLSSKLGQDLAAANGLPLVAVQHHHAHVAACMADNDLALSRAPVLGIVLDGLGYGEDGTLWGGEVLLADYNQYCRLASLQPIALLGGAQAMHQPWRNTYAHLMYALGWEALADRYGHLELVQWLAQKPLVQLDRMLQRGLHSPLASSCGRLFDAVAAAVGLCRDRASYEGQGAMQLETLARTGLDLVGGQGYTWNLIAPAPTHPSALGPEWVIDPTSMWQELLVDLKVGRSPPEIAARFHLGFGQTLVQVVLALSQQHRFEQIALTGGVFQNRLLLEQVGQQLRQLGFQVLCHRRVPPNDGGLSLGQAVIAAARSRAEEDRDRCV
jgi:hydrogenase maturation protein HypF